MVQRCDSRDTCNKACHIATTKNPSGYIKYSICVMHEKFEPLCDALGEDNIHSKCPAGRSIGYDKVVFCLP
jgi:hypothetical protein